MLPFNEEFQTGESKITQIRLSVLLNNGTLLSLTEEHVMLGGLSRDSSTTVDGAFTVGAAVTGKLTVVLDNSDQSLSEYDFRAAVITASLGGQLSDGNYELIQIGIYTVDGYTYDGSNITLTAYDNFHKFDLPCSESSVTFPRTITQLITQACSLAGVTLANASIPNGSYSVTEQPESWDTMTWHDVVSYCAQIGCCFARILPNGKLFLSWYDTSAMTGDQYDGGTYDTETTPYSDGAALDGGDFDYTQTVSADGGTFDDREDVTIIGSNFDLTVDTDDVLITGVTVVLAVANNINATDGTQDYEKTLGTSGYVIRIENNPLIETTANADAVCAYLYDYLVGMRFRPLNASIPENPAIEAGDVALVVDRYNNTYTSFMSHVTYTTNSSTQVSCDAESTMQNLNARYSEAQKTRAMAQRAFEKAITDAESAMQTIMSALATTMGLYKYTQSDGQGGTIIVYGNKNTLAASNIRWKFSAGAMMVSSNYGQTWNGAITADGIAVLQEIYAVKVNADNILTGNISIGGTSGNKNGALNIKDENGNVIATMSKSGVSVKGSITSGSTVTGTTITGGSITGTTIKAGGNNNQAGTIEIYNSSGNRISRLDSNGIYFGDIASSLSAPAIRIAEGGGYSRIYSNGTFHSCWIGSGELNLFNGPNYNGGAMSLFVTDPDDTSISAVGRITAAGNLRLVGSPYVLANSLIVSEGKGRLVNSKNYGNRILYCYETPTPYFGDIGTGCTDENGEAIIDIDGIFDETVNLKIEYCVFLQKEGKGDIWVEEKDSAYFVVKGTPNLKFSWEIKAVQRDYEQYRLEELELPKQIHIPDDGLEEMMDKEIQELDEEVLFEEVI